MKNYLFLSLSFLILVTLSQTPQPDPDYSKQAEWKGECNIGKSQSPILISTSQVKLCPYNKKYYLNFTQAQIAVHPFGKNLRSTFSHQTVIKYIENQVENGFFSSQFHWHVPSQHWIDGERFDMELHILHANDVDPYSYGVVSLLFKIDPSNKPDTFDKIDFINDSQNRTYAFPFNLKDKFVFHYKGSLTTPLCQPQVDWFVYMDPFLIRKQNLDKIKSIINDGKSNARYVQDLNYRSIQLIGGLCNNNPIQLFQN